MALMLKFEVHGCEILDKTRAREKVNLVVKWSSKISTRTSFRNATLGPLSTSFFPASLSTFCLVQCSVASQANQAMYQKYLRL